MLMFQQNRARADPSRMATRSMWLIGWAAGGAQVSADQVVAVQPPGPISR